MRGRTGGAAEKAEIAYDQVFRALGDPHRLRIVELLSKKEMSAGEVLDSLDIVQSTLSHHMKTLTQAGVVTATRHGKWVCYSLNLEVLRKADRRIGELAEAGEKLLAETLKAQAENSLGTKRTETSDTPGNSEKSGSTGRIVSSRVTPSPKDSAETEIKPLPLPDAMPGSLKVQAAKTAGTMEEAADRKPEWTRMKGHDRSSGYAEAAVSSDRIGQSGVFAFADGKNEEGQEAQKPPGTSSEDIEDKIDIVDQEAGPEAESGPESKTDQAERETDPDALKTNVRMPEEELVRYGGRPWDRDLSESDEDDEEDEYEDEEDEREMEEDAEPDHASGSSDSSAPPFVTDRALRQKNEKSGRKDRDEEDSEESKKKKGKKNKKSKKKKN
jgi:ArsR family transcriptional regulator